MRIPVDYVAGTSIGSIVGGLYAIGMPPDRMAEELKTIDWEDALSDDSGPEGPRLPAQGGRPPLPHQRRAGALARKARRPHRPRRRSEARVPHPAADLARLVRSATSTGSRSPSGPSPPTSRRERPSSSARGTSRGPSARAWRSRASSRPSSWDGPPPRRRRRGAEPADRRRPEDGGRGRHRRRHLDAAREAGRPQGVSRGPRADDRSFLIPPERREPDRDASGKGPSRSRPTSRGSRRSASPGSGRRSTGERPRAAPRPERLRELLGLPGGVRGVEGGPSAPLHRRSSRHLRAARRDGRAASITDIVSNRIEVAPGPLDWPRLYRSLRARLRASATTRRSTSSSKGRRTAGS
ncbi:MAG: patatin-like phospholipase family protein [Comamonadaceae bacterium]|nr:patatin-like phospholipase family protein [Comamonadaceae bacterium]